MRKLKNGSVEISVYLPEGLALEVKTLLMDPKFGRVRYGAMKALLTRLLSEWVEQRRKGVATVEPFDIPPDTHAEFEDD